MGWVRQQVTREDRKGVAYRQVTNSQQEQIALTDDLLGSVRACILPSGYTYAIIDEL